MNEPFRFLDPGDLRDGDIHLRLVKTIPADDARGFVPAYAFDIRLNDGGAKAGEISLRVGHNENIFYGGNIGYHVDPPYRGHRYALKACRLLLTLARRHGMESLLITCNPENLPSRRTCELLEAELLEIVDLPECNDMYLEGERRKCRYRVRLD